MRSRRILRLYLREKEKIVGARPCKYERRLRKVASKAVLSRRPWAQAFLKDCLAARIDSRLTIDLLKMVGASGADWASVFLKELRGPWNLLQAATRALGERMTSDRLSILEDLAFRGQDAAYEVIARYLEQPDLKTQALSFLVAGLSASSTTHAKECAKLLAKTSWDPPDHKRTAMFLSAIDKAGLVDKNIAEGMLRFLRDERRVDELLSITKSDSVFALQSFSCLDEAVVSNGRFAALLMDVGQKSKMIDSAFKAIERRGCGREFLPFLAAILPGLADQYGRRKKAISLFCSVAELTEKPTLLTLLGESIFYDWNAVAGCGPVKGAIAGIGVSYFRQELLALLSPGPRQDYAAKAAMELLAGDREATIPREILYSWLQIRDLDDLAALYLSTHPDPDAYDLLVEALKHSWGVKKSRMVRALSAIGDAKAIVPIIQSCVGGECDEGVRGALLALGASNDYIDQALLAIAWESVRWDEPFLKRRDEDLTGGIEYKWAEDHKSNIQRIGLLLRRCPREDVPTEILEVIKTLPSSINYYYTFPYPGDYDPNRSDGVFSGCIDFRGWKEAAQIRDHHP